MSVKTKGWWKSMLAVVAAGGLSSGAANADITLNLTNETLEGFLFLPFLGDGEFAQGTLTAVSANATLDASTGNTYADDLCIYVDPLPLSTGGLLQVGGFSNLEATQRYSWPNGASSAPGTTVIGTVNLVTPLDFTGTAADATIWLGNGYNEAGGTSGTWTGSVTLVGITAVPEPTTTGLLLAGAALSAGSYYRRRRS